MTCIYEWRQETLELKVFIAKVFPSCSDRMLQWRIQPRSTRQMLRYEATKTSPDNFEMTLNDVIYTVRHVSVEKAGKKSARLPQVLMRKFYIVQTATWHDIQPNAECLRKYLYGQEGFISYIGERLRIGGERTSFRWSYHANTNFRRSKSMFRNWKDGQRSLRGRAAVHRPGSSYDMHYTK